MLVLVDYATRYPEAVPLRTISAKSVAQALFQVISQVGIPKEIMTDHATSYMSRTLRELYGLLGKSIRTSVYHPLTDGLVERLNKTFKSMICKLIQVDECNWTNWLDPLLFAVREVPQASRDSLPLNYYLADNHGAYWTYLEKTGRKVQATVRMQFSMSWTWEQNSTHWGSYHVRICSGPSHFKSACTTEEPSWDNSHREKKYLYCSPLIALNY